MLFGMCVTCILNESDDGWRINNKDQEFKAEGCIFMMERNQIHIMELDQLIKCSH